MEKNIYAYKEEESIESTRQNHADKLEKLYADLKRSIITNKIAPTETDVK